MATMDNITDTVLDRLQEINDDLADIEIKGEDAKVVVYRVLPVGPQTFKPFLYAEVGPAFWTPLTYGSYSVSREFYLNLVVQPFTTDQFDADEGSIAVMDTYAAEHVLVSHYAPRQRLELDGRPLIDITSSVISRSESTTFQREQGNPKSPLYAGVRLTLLISWAQYVR